MNRHCIYDKTYYPHFGEDANQGNAIFDYDCSDFITVGDLSQVKQQFGLIATVAKLGDIFGLNQKESNDWKTRMLNAGLGNQGLIMPENWNELNEADKEARLNLVINELNK